MGFFLLYFLSQIKRILQIIVFSICLICSISEKFQTKHLVFLLSLMKRILQIIVYLICSICERYSTNIYTFNRDQTFLHFNNRFLPVINLNVKHIFQRKL